MILMKVSDFKLLFIKGRKIDPLIFLFIGHKQ